MNSPSTHRGRDRPDPGGHRPDGLQRRGRRRRRAAAAAGACDPADVKLVGQVRNESNPYEAAWLDGGDAFAESVGLSSSGSPTTVTRPSSRSRSASSSPATPSAWS